VPVPVALPSKTLVVLVLSNTRIVGLNPARGMDVCPGSLCCTLLRMDSLCN
jgi:hypothetical protein